MYDVWCYWSQGVECIPQFELLCLKSWQRNLSEKFKVHVVDKHKFLQMQDEFDIDFFDTLTVQQQSDVVRLKLLEMHGGIWIDISTILTDDLLFITKKFNEGYDYVGFYIKEFATRGDKNVLENWFLAIKHKEHYMIKVWKAAFVKILREKNQFGAIEKSPLWKSTEKESIPDHFTTYLPMHVAHLWCLQNDPKYKEIYRYKSFLYDAKKTALVGVSHGFHVKGLLTTFTMNRIGYNANFPILKIRGCDKPVVKYFSSYRLSRIIHKNTGEWYGIHPVLLDLTRFCIFVVVVLSILRRLTPTVKLMCNRRS